MADGIIRCRKHQKLLPRSQAKADAKASRAAALMTGKDGCKSTIRAAALMADAKADAKASELLR
jgi:hypothetical protein